MTERSRFAKYRDRKRGGPPRELKPCGSGSAAYKRHKDRGEPVCDACREWRRQYDRNRPRKDQQ